MDQAITKALACKATPKEEMLLDVYADASVPPRRGHYPRREAEVALAETTKTMLMLEAVRDAQDLALEQDKGVFLLGEDIGDPPGGLFATSKGLQIKHGAARVRPTPIAETAIIGAGIGAACNWGCVRLPRSCSMTSPECASTRFSITPPNNATCQEPRHTSR